MDWFDQRNVSLKIENDNRIFPESNSSQTIMDCFLKEVQSKNFEIKTQSVVLEIQKLEKGIKSSPKKEKSSPIM